MTGAKIWTSGEKLYASDLTDLRNRTLPPGAMLPFGGDRIPRGYRCLLALGQQVSRTTYADLFEVYGTKYGVGDGSTTFNLPDMRERVPVGARGLNADSSLESCETAWTGSTNVTVTTSTDRQVGTYSNKFAIGAGFTTGLIAYKDISSIDLSGQDCIIFWIKPSIDLSAGYLQVVLDDTSACASPVETIDLPALYKDQWNKILIYLANPTLDGAIVSIGLKSTNDFGACDIYVDDFNYGQIRDITVEDCEDAWDEQSISDVTRTADGTYKVRGSYSAKFAIASGFTTGIIGSEVIAKDLSRNGYLIAWVRSSVALNAGDMQLLLDDTANCASPVETLDIPALTANTWTRIALRFANDSNTRSALISIGLKMVVDKGAMDFYIDDIFCPLLAEAGMIGGEKKHKQLEAELSAHNHSPITNLINGTSTGSGNLAGGSSSSGMTATIPTNGSSTPFNLLQPYVTVTWLIYY